MRDLRRSWPALAMALLAGCAGDGPGQPAPVTVRQVANAAATSSGQPIRPPAGPNRIVLSDYRIAAGARLPVHRHPYPRYAVVQSGTLAVTNQDTGQTAVFRKGELVVEAIGQWHSAVNDGPEEVHLLVLDEVPAENATGHNTVLRP